MTPTLLAAVAPAVQRGVAVDVLSAVLVLAGVVLALLAGVGLVRFDDVLARMHAATKPATLGLLLLAIGTGLQLPWHYAGLLVLVVVFQLISAPVAAHLVGRAAYRTAAHSAYRLGTDALAGTDSPAS